MNLDTSYLGLKLRNPLVASAGPMTQTADRIERLVEAGVGAVVLPSLFEEQIRAEADRDERLAEVGIDSFGEAMTYLIDPDASIWPRQYLGLIERAAGYGVPLIASLNGSTVGGWTDYARAMQDAGAAAIELNIYYLPADLTATSPVSARDNEQRYIDIVTMVKSAVSVPVAVKLTPPQLSRRDGGLPGPGRRGRPCLVQPVHADRHQPRHPHHQHRVQAVEPGRGHGGSILDRPAARPTARLARRQHRRGDRR